jgi:hypothetical protein
VICGDNFSVDAGWDARKFKEIPFEMRVFCQSTPRPDADEIAKLGINPLQYDLFTQALRTIFAGENLPKKSSDNGSEIGGGGVLEVGAGAEAQKRSWFFKPRYTQRFQLQIIHTDESASAESIPENRRNRIVPLK